MSEEDQKPPLDFDKLTKPTHEQIKALWDSTKRPTIRKVSELARQRGWSIAPSTVLRWRKNKWKDDGDPRKKPRVEKKFTRAAWRAKQSAEVMCNAPPMKDDPKVNEALTALRTPNDTALSSLPALLKLSKAELKEQAEKVLLSATIIIGEHMIDKAHAMALVPREVGGFISESSNMVRQIAPGEETPPGETAKTIEAVPVEAKSNPLADNIRAFRAKTGL